MKRKVISCVLAGASVFSLVCINGGNLVAKADGDVTEIRFTEWDGRRYPGCVRRRLQRNSTRAIRISM